MIETKSFELDDFILRRNIEDTLCDPYAVKKLCNRNM